MALGIRRERRSKRGTTFIEATLVITTLVILWAGGRYLGKMTAQRLDAQASARDCGWRIALAACAEEIEDCSGESYEQGKQDPELDQVSKEGEETQGEQGGERVNDELESHVSGLFITRVSSKVSRQVARPPLLGGESIAIGGSLSLPCNTKPQSADDMFLSMASDIWNSLNGRSDSTEELEADLAAGETGRTDTESGQ